MKYADLKGIIEFIYNGEVSIDQGALTSFLIAAESLKIKGNYSGTFKLFILRGVKQCFSKFQGGKHPK